MVAIEKRTDLSSAASHDSWELSKFSLRELSAGPKVNFAFRIRRGEKRIASFVRDGGKRVLSHVRTFILLTNESSFNKLPVW